MMLDISKSDETHVPLPLYVIYVTTQHYIRISIQMFLQFTLTVMLLIIDRATST